MRSILIVTVLMAICAGGCFNVKEYNYVVAKNSELRAQNSDLEKLAGKLAGENAALNEKLRVMSGVNDQFRYDNLNATASMEVYRLSGIYDLKKNGHANLLVYLIPRDGNGDAIKAAGNLTIELWNMAKGSDEAMVARWEVEADTLRKEWGMSMLSAYYRLKFDLPGDLPKDGDYFIRAAFTDFLSGKVITVKQGIAIKS